MQLLDRRGDSSVCFPDCNGKIGARSGESLHPSGRNDKGQGSRKAARPTPAQATGGDLMGAVHANVLNNQRGLPILPKTVMANIRILLVDDDEIVRLTLTSVLEQCGFVITTAACVPEALKYISSETYDVLLSDLHMPGAGDGLTVVSAMRHANPRAVTLLLSAFPEMTAAAQAILLQADQILVKPMDAALLVEIIKQRVADGPLRAREIEDVAAILDRTTQIAIAEWYERVQADEKLMSISISDEQRCGHLPLFFRELISRLRFPRPMGSKDLISAGAAKHGLDRFRQGYSAAMLVKESRLLQVSIFQILQNNLASIDFSLLLGGVMTIADEIDSQLSQAMASYSEESLRAA
jgi:CheY-like chemotaxis protein